MIEVETVIIGAGAAGLFCATETAKRGRRTLLLDHAKKPGEKIRISGGGRCNFTNLETDAARFISRNPHFAKSALARYSPWDFCSRMADHELTWHEKTLGQLFCDQKSGAVIDMLVSDLQAAGAQMHLNTTVDEIDHSDGQFHLSTSLGPVRSHAVVIATGGLSIPKMGATGFAYDIAKQFGHDIIPTRPALVPFTFTGKLHEDFGLLSGVSANVEARAVSGPSFVENLLFTHRGLSGPAILQASSYWNETEIISIDLIPGQSADAFLIEARSRSPRQSLNSLLSSILPARLADQICKWQELDPTLRLAELSNKKVNQLAQSLSKWQVKPVGTEGWRTAEVTAGGIDTSGLSSKTMESKHQSGLYFIGECVDVTGWLGGYNFQWAWASAFAAGAVA